MRILENLRALFGKKSMPVEEPYVLGTIVSTPLYPYDDGTTVCDFESDAGHKVQMALGYSGFRKRDRLKLLVSEADFNQMTHYFLNDRNFQSVERPRPTNFTYVPFD